MIVLTLHWQVPKTFHQKFLFPALGHYHVDLDLSVSTCCAFMCDKLKTTSYRVITFLKLIAWSTSNMEQRHIFSVM